MMLSKILLAAVAVIGVHSMKKGEEKLDQSGEEKLNQPQKNLISYGFNYEVNDRVLFSRKDIWHPSTITQVYKYRGETVYDLGWGESRTAKRIRDRDIKFPKRRPMCPKMAAMVESFKKELKPALEVVDTNPSQCKVCAERREVIEIIYQKRYTPAELAKVKKDAYDRDAADPCPGCNNGRINTGISHNVGGTYLLVKNPFELQKRCNLYRAIRKQAHTYQYGDNTFTIYKRCNTRADQPEFYIFTYASRLGRYWHISTGKGTEANRNIQLFPSDQYSVVPFYTKFSPQDEESKKVYCSACKRRFSQGHYKLHKKNTKDSQCKEGTYVVDFYAKDASATGAAWQFTPPKTIISAGTYGTSIKGEWFNRECDLGDRRGEAVGTGVKVTALTREDALRFQKKAGATLASRKEAAELKRVARLRRVRFEEEQARIKKEMANKTAAEAVRVNALTRITVDLVGNASGKAEKTIVLTVRLTDTIEMVKQLIRGEVGEAPEQLFFNGVLLQNGTTLAENKVKAESTLELPSLTFTRGVMQRLRDAAQN